jgi:ketose-bisphosphate aldolase
MALESMTRMLTTARTEKYAIGAFNILDYNTTRAVIQAAEEVNSPVIVQTSVKTINLWGYRAIITWIRQLTEEVKIPVALHLDHCQDLTVIRECINQGWTSVMIDASSKPFDENVQLTSEVVDLAKPKKVSVEAELGAIVGVEDDLHISDQEAHLADVDQSVKLNNDVQINCFAPAIGTAHGLYKGEPKIAFDRLREISEKIHIPLALHGGTGLSADIFKKCINLGCSKINVSTQLKHVFIDSFVNYYQAKPDEYNPLKEINAQFEALKNEIKNFIQLFGSVDKAEKGI